MAKKRKKDKEKNPAIPKTIFIFKHEAERHEDGKEPQPIYADIETCHEDAHNATDGAQTYSIAEYALVAVRNFTSQRKIIEIDEG